jgi:hypothetical protein
VTSFNLFLKIIIVADERMDSKGQVCNEEDKKEQSLEQFRLRTVNLK